MLTITPKQSILLVIVLSLIGCSASRDSMEVDGERLIMRTPDPCQAWITSEPGESENEYQFVGVSLTYAEESLARDDGIRNAGDRVLTYMGTLAENKFTEHGRQFGLSSKVFDPALGAERFRENLSKNIMRTLRAKEWCIEKWRRPTGTGWKAYCLASVDKSSLGMEFKQTATDQAKEAENNAKEEGDAEAMDQVQKYLEFIQQINPETVFEPDEE